MSDSTTYIPTVTPENVISISFREMMDGITPYALIEVPEGASDPESLQQIDDLLGKLANLYSYLIVLYSHVANEAARLKIIGLRDEYSLMVRKKDALFEIARGIRYKHQACSRKITAHQEEEGLYERADYRGREERRDRRVRGWQPARD